MSKCIHGYLISRKRYCKDCGINNLENEIEELQSQLAEKDKAIVEAIELILELYGTFEDVHDSDSVKVWLEKYGSK